MRVPKSSGAKVFFTYIGMPCFTTGWIVGGYTTFAPKCESSRASLYEMFLIGRASATTRGSAVIMPHTSVHISSLRAWVPTAMIEAV